MIQMDMWSTSLLLGLIFNVFGPGSGLSCLVCVALKKHEEMCKDNLYIENCNTIEDYNATTLVLKKYQAAVEANLRPRNAGPQALVCVKIESEYRVPGSPAQDVIIRSCALLPRGQKVGDCHAFTRTQQNGAVFDGTQCTCQGEQDSVCNGSSYLHVGLHGILVLAFIVVIVIVI